MARLRDLKVGMKVEIVKGKEDPEDFGLKLTDCQVGSVGTVSFIDKYDPVCQVSVTLPDGDSWYYPSSWIKIIKDEGETEMTQKTKVKQEVTPKKYILIYDDDHTRVFTDASAHGICKVSNEDWGFEMYETINRLSSGKIKLFKIEEVKLEITEPSIKIVG